MVQVVQPLLVRIVVRLCPVFVAMVALYRVRADGLLAPAVGLITVSSLFASLVSGSRMKKCERVELSQLFLTIDFDPAVVWRSLRSADNTSSRQPSIRCSTPMR